jgi:hypothetical protein
MAERYTALRGYITKMADALRFLSTVIRTFQAYRGFLENIEAMKILAKSFIWLITGVVLVALCVVAIAFLHTYSKERRADQLLAVVTHFAVGKTSEAEAMGKVQPFLAGFTSQGKADAGVDYRAFIFDNIELTKLRLSHYRRFTIRLRFRDGVLIEKDAEFSVEHDCRVQVVDRVRELPQANQAVDSAYRNHYSTVPSGFLKPVDLATVIDDDTYPEPLKSLDWKFNLRYLKHLGGCNDARLILPALSR